jgi:hypothetical protein
MPFLFFNAKQDYRANIATFKNNPCTLYTCSVCFVRCVSNLIDSFPEGPHRKKNILIIQTQHKSTSKSHTSTAILNHFPYAYVTWVKHLQYLSPVVELCPGVGQFKGSVHVIVSINSSIHSTLYLSGNSVSILLPYQTSKPHLFRETLPDDLCCASHHSFFSGEWSLWKITLLCPSYSVFSWYLAEQFLQVTRYK